MAETTFYSNGAVQITNAHAVIGGKTYAMANIASVTAGKLPIRSPAFFITALVGPIIFVLGLIGAFGSTNSFACSGLGFILPAAGIAGIVYQIRKPVFAVVLDTNNGSVQAVSSRDRDMIVNGVTALNEAIVHRG
jgi:hypothetical protein